MGSIIAAHVYTAIIGPKYMNAKPDSSNRRIPTYAPPTKPPRPPSSGDINVNLTIDQAAELYATTLHARNQLREAIRKQHVGDIGYSFGYMDAQLTKVAEAIDPRVRRKIYEKLKPKTKQCVHLGYCEDYVADGDNGMCDQWITCANYNTENRSTTSGGGGNKPD